LEYDPDILPFIIKSNQEEEERQNDAIPNKYTYKLVSESLIFMEDDRLERPFIVLEMKDESIKHLWVVVINIQEHKIV